MELTNSSAIVTGGASGIGAAAARMLAKKGAKVVIADLQADKGEALAKEIDGAFCKVDVTNTQDIINAVEMATSMGPIRALVNSAGIGWAQRTIGRDGTVESAANLDAYKKVIAINLFGSYSVTSQVHSLRWPRNVCTARAVEPTPSGFSEVRSDSCSPPCQSRSLAKSLTNANTSSMGRSFTMLASSLGTLAPPSALRRRSHAAGTPSVWSDQRTVSTAVQSATRAAATGVTCEMIRPLRAKSTRNGARSPTDPQPRALAPP